MIHFWAGPYSFLYAHSAPTLFSRACRAVVGLGLKGKHRVRITSVMSLGLCGLGKRQPFRQVGSWNWRSTILIFVPFPLSFATKCLKWHFIPHLLKNFGDKIEVFFKIKVNRTKERVWQNVNKSKKKECCKWLVLGSLACSVWTYLIIYLFLWKKDILSDILNVQFWLMILLFKIQTYGYHNCTKTFMFLGTNHVYFIIGIGFFHLVWLQDAKICLIRSIRIILTTQSSWKNGWWWIFMFSGINHKED